MSIAKLFLAERRHKSAAEAEAIEASQRAAEAGSSRWSQLAAAEIKDGMLWSDGEHSRRSAFTRALNWSWERWASRAPK